MELLPCLCLIKEVNQDIFNDLNIIPVDGFCKKCAYELEDEWNYCPRCSLFKEKNNDNSMYCKNCGCLIKEAHSFCSRCGEEIRESNSDLKKAKNDSIPFVLYFLFAGLSLIVPNIFGNSLLLILGHISALVFLISGRVNYSDSKVLKIIFNIFIILYVIYLIFVIIAICMYAYMIYMCTQCPG